MRCNAISILPSLLLIVSCSSEKPHVGLTVWQENCQVCHQVGLAGAPKFGDVQAWTKRLKRGRASLYTHALEGWGDMPARGGNPALTDQQVKQAVDYMIENSQ